MLTILARRVAPEFDDIPLPEYATNGSAGADIRAALSHDVLIPPSSIATIPTGIALEIPPGYEIQVRSRSGLAARYGIFCLNSPGTIDSDFRGEVQVILANFGKEPFIVRRGDRIAQLVVARYEHVQWQESSHLSCTERGQSGFGSTGIQ
ncbi:MAG: dUTP diphosphatase [Bacteroidota bacterium]|nr:dUTP diphosphatase [Candidatus Kapabacteria bacterium]MDW8219007.1 dUTP diphosphatase [Bacteroidota bacterium]